jgi:hypothetical protein
MTAAGSTTNVDAGMSRQEWHMAEHLHPDLERRIRALENESEQGAGFTAQDWIWLIALGVILPVVVLYAGWPT